MSGRRQIEPQDAVRLLCAFAQEHHGDAGILIVPSKDGSVDVHTWGHAVFVQGLMAAAYEMLSAAVADEEHDDDEGGTTCTSTE